MKKILKLSLVIVSILLLLLQGCCYATNNVEEPEGQGIPAEWARTLDPDVSAEDMILDGANETLYNTNENDGIMLINEEDGIMPISDNTELSGDIVEDDVYLCEQNVSLEKNVSGNVYVMAKNVNISSEYINGNIFAMGQDVTIKGYVYGSIYVMGQNINIDAECIGTVYALGKNITLAENAAIYNDLKVSADSLYINGNIARRLDAFVENINVSDKTQLIGKGHVSYSTELVDPNGKLEGLEVVQHEKTSEKVQGIKEVVTIGKIQTEVISAISTILLIGIIYLIIRNRKTEKVENYAQEVVSNILKGFLWLVVTPIVSIMLLCTIIGIPVSLLVITIYIVALFISVPVASLRIAELIFASNPKENKIILLLYAIAVYVVIRVITYLPVIGGIVSFLVLLYGIESLVKYIIPSQNKKAKKENEIVVEENK